MLKVPLYKSLQALLITGLFSLGYGCTTLISPLKRDTLPELSLGGATQSFYTDDSALVRAKNTAIKTGLNGELIFYLLSAELAGQRNDLDYALEVYSALTLKTQHPLIAERTSWIAQFAQQPKAALDAAILWATLAPESANAQRTAAGLLLQNEQYLDAFEYLLNFERLSSESNYTLLANHLTEKHNPVISDLYQRMLKEQQQRAKPSDDLETALALLTNELGDQQATQQHLTRALAADANNVRALQLKAHLLSAAGDFKAAEQLLRQATQNNPEEVRLWLDIARTQLKAAQFNQAEQTFDHIISLQPNNLPIRLALARIQIETDQYAAAQQTLEALTGYETLADQAWLLLGQLAERDKKWQLALQHYDQIISGEPLLEAIRASVRLLIQQNKTHAALVLLQEKRYQSPELSIPLTLMGEQLLRQQQDFTAAIEWVDEGRQLLPENQESSQLLYSRALLNFHLQDLTQMEADLRQLLDFDPNNAMALNALGYTLVDQTERINEGLLLIQKAHALDSESAEILDSLGWALFKLARYEEAFEYLAEAYARLPENEIAEHLIQVLWKLNKSQQAKTLLQQHPELDLKPIKN
ncbi:MAG TPA: tetratricopeptide repeat protein [Marinospirillum sp.]|uniref:tetratricopeptide repeat protein n=1 Tax=Marinospirillum sp. TaxID=2183934 RepID=UPI002B46BBC6|nr:tetratricopeptide repeat protein [Marinospirillum sp.]HKM14340.1 tetratricopeptide repeat protein [Marinospirillum sp.]